MSSRWQLTGTILMVTLGLVAGPAAAQNLLLNPGFEDGYTTNWTLETGTLTGTGLGESPHSGLKSWHGAWNWGGSAQTTTYYQDVAISAGATCNASMWCKANAWGGVYGNDTHYFKLAVQFIDATQAVLDGSVVQSPQPDDTYQQLVLNNLVAPAGTTAARVKFSYVTTQSAHEWKVWNIDDLEFTVDCATQHLLTSIDPPVADNTANITARIYGTNLDYATGASLVHIGGAATIVGTNLTPAGDGSYVDVDFAISGQPYGVYDVVVDQSGGSCASRTLANGFELANPNAAANLLLNPSFEIPDPGAGDTGNEPLWFGNYELDSTIWGPTPATVDGAHRWGVAAGGGSDFSRELRQVVAVNPGDTLVLRGWVAVGSGANASNSATIRLYDGAIDNNILLDSVVISKGTPRSNGDWAEAVVIGTATADTVTAQIWMELDSGPDWNSGDDYAAVHLDAFELYSTADCLTPHTTAAPASPSLLTQDDDPTITLSGTGLDQVTNVKLIQIPTWTVFEAVNFSTTGGTSLEADFAFPVGGAPLGFYNVVTEQPSCQAQVLVNGIEIYCSNPTSLTGLSLTELTKPVGAVDIAVLGENVDQLDTVSLVWTPEPRNPPGDRPPYWMPVVEIAGSVVNDSNPNAVLYEFDLYNAQAGSYKLVGVRNDVCGSPAEMLGAFTLLLPAEDNYLPNGGFEDGTLDPWQAEVDLSINGGVTEKGDPIPGPDVAYTNYVGENDPENVGFPLVDGIEDPYSGDEVHYAHGGNYLAGLYTFTFESSDPGPDNAGLEWNTWLTPNAGWIRQSLGVPNGPGHYEIVLSFWVRIWDERWPHGELAASFKIDGVSQTPLTISFPGYGEASQDGFDPYTQLSIDYIGDVQNDITVEFYFKSENDEGGTYSAATMAIALDDVELFGITPCNDPFADADGDGDVDQDDFAVLQVCYSGEGSDTPATPTYCRCFDRTPEVLDGDVDATDVTAFEACASGPDVPANITCDD